MLKTDNNWNNKGNQAAFKSWLLSNIAELDDLAQQHDAYGIREKLSEIVPEYNKNDSECVL